MKTVPKPMLQYFLYQLRIRCVINTQNSLVNNVNVPRLITIKYVTWTVTYKDLLPERSAITSTSIITTGNMLDGNNAEKNNNT